MSILRPVDVEPVITRLYNEMHYGRTEILILMSAISVLTIPVLCSGCSAGRADRESNGAVQVLAAFTTGLPSGRQSETRDSGLTPAEPLQRVADFRSEADLRCLLNEISADREHVLLEDGARPAINPFDLSADHQLQFPRIVVTCFAQWVFPIIHDSADEDRIGGFGAIEPVSCARLDFVLNGFGQQIINIATV